MGDGVKGRNCRRIALREYLCNLSSALLSWVPNGKKTIGWGMRI